MENAEKITEEFFKRRFPEKNIEFEKQCGYFDEWVSRFEVGCHEEYMDNESLNIWEEMQKEEKEEIIAREQAMDKELNKEQEDNLLLRRDE